MKKLFILFCLPLLFSCGSGNMEVASTGKPYEIFVIASKPVWTGAVGDSIRNTFNEEVLWINQPEPIFDIYNITPQGLNDNVKLHRNLLFVTIDPAYDSCSFAVRNNVWAKNQVVMDLKGNNADSLAAYWVANSADIVTWISNVERDRMSARAKNYNMPAIDKVIAQKFGLYINIPQGFKVNKDADNFLWLGSELKLGVMGVVIYSFERAGDTPLNLLNQRNIAAGKVPGPSDGSYMTTDTTFFAPEASGFELGGQQWVEIHGFWKVHNDFMGGPFINYTTFNKSTGRYIGIDMFVNSPSPKYTKRNYIRQLEAIIMNASVGALAPKS